MDISRVVKMADSVCASCASPSRSLFLSSSTHSESVASASDSELSESLLATPAVL